MAGWFAKFGPYCWQLNDVLVDLGWRVSMSTSQKVTHSDNHLCDATATPRSKSQQDMCRSCFIVPVDSSRKEREYHAMDKQTCTKIVYTSARGVQWILVVYHVAVCEIRRDPIGFVTTRFKTIATQPVKSNTGFNRFARFWSFRENLSWLPGPAMVVSSVKCFQLQMFGAEKLCTNKLCRLVMV